MKKFQLLAALLVFLSASGSALAAPNMVISPREFNFGKVPQQSTFTSIFWIKSTGSDTVRITEIDPGCSCTQMPLHDSTIAPGDSVPLGIVFKSGRMRGQIAKAPRLKTSISDEYHYIKLYAEAVVDSLPTMPLTVAPLMLDVSQFSEKPRRKATVKITNRSATDLTLELREGGLKSFDIALPPIVKAGATVEVRLTVKADKVATNFEESFTIAVGDENRTVFSVPVVRIYKGKPAPDGALQSGSKSH